MLPLERKQEILKIITKDKSVKVNVLSEMFDVTEETIRRDLEKLEKENFVKRTYGGAVVLDNVSEETSFTERAQEHMDEKRHLAKYVSEFIKDGDTIMMDSSTTALEVLRRIDPELSVTIISNSVSAALEAAKNSNIKFISTGGILNHRTMSFDGPLACKTLANYYADKAIISVKGLDRKKGLMDSREVSAESKQVMIDSAKQIILMADESKFDKTALLKVSGFDRIDVLVTNHVMSDEWAALMEENQVQVVVIPDEI